MFFVFCVCVCVAKDLANRCTDILFLFIELFIFPGKVYIYILPCKKIAPRKRKPPIFFLFSIKNKFKNGRSIPLPLI